MKKKILALTLVVAILAIAAMGTLAYFTDKDSNSNVVTLGNVDIVLDEAAVTYDPETYTWTAGDERVDSNTYGNVYPGAVMPKDPTVHNEGSVDAYVRVKVTVTDYANWAFLMGGKLNVTAHPEYLNLLVGDLGTGWTITDVTTSGQDAIYTIQYGEILAAGESTTPVFQNVTIPTDFAKRSAGDSQAYIDKLMGSDRTFNIDVVAEAIQAPGFTSIDDAFAAFTTTKPYGN